MTIAEEHISPDGLLRFVACLDDGGDLTLGFSGFPWHTHADILASLSGLSESEAVRKFIEELLNDRAVIALLSTAGEVCDIWVCDDPERDVSYPIEAEAIELRHWSGCPWVAS